MGESVNQNMNCRPCMNGADYSMCNRWPPYEGSFVRVALDAHVVTRKGICYKLEHYKSNVILFRYERSGMQLLNLLYPNISLECTLTMYSGTGWWLQTGDAVKLALLSRH